jgi:hypothetical protein
MILLWFLVIGKRGRWPAANVLEAQERTLASQRVVGFDPLLLGYF